MTKKKQYPTTIRIPAEIMNAAGEAATNQGISRNAWIAQAMTEKLAAEQYAPGTVKVTK